MTASPAPAFAAACRPRPRIHFTAREGWINDPYGIAWTGDRYRMFYQAIPGRATWGPECGWGSAEAPDLVRWRELPPALEPQEFEIGCWSGTAVLSATPPRLFYTRITGPDWANGSIASARGDDTLQTWSTGVDDVVIPYAPADLGVTTLRDAYVFRHSDDWMMIVGAGLADGSGAAVQFRSPDLITWSCDGLLYSQASDAAEVPTGQVWECPQFFPLGDVWVLLVSVWDDDELYYVAAAVGDYDGHQFEPRTWQRLTFGSSAYAMTAFEDRDGRRCVLSWLREEPRNDPNRAGWVGAHSVASLITLGATGALELTPHPDLTSMADQMGHPFAADPDGPLRISLKAGAAEVTLRPEAGAKMSVSADTGQLASIEFRDDHLRITRPKLPAGSMPVDRSQPLVVLIDADIIEIFGPGGYGAFRIGIASDAGTTEVVLSSSHPDLSVRLF